MKNQDNVIGMLVLGLGAMLLLSMIANNPRINPLWRRVALTAEGEIYQHVVSKELITLLV